MKKCVNYFGHNSSAFFMVVMNKCLLESLKRCKYWFLLKYFFLADIYTEICRCNI